MHLRRRQRRRQRRRKRRRKRRRRIPFFYGDLANAQIDFFLKKSNSLLLVQNGVFLLKNTIFSWKYVFFVYFLGIFIDARIYL